MKQIILSILGMIILSYPGSSQFYKVVSGSPDFSDAISKIVLDFRYNFQNIQGEQIAKQGSSETYACNILIPGAIETYIYQYNSKIDTTGSVQVVMFRSDDFKSAAKKYSELFKMLKRTQIRWVDKSYVGFKGDFQKPSEEIRFASSSLGFDLNDERYDDFKVDVELVSSYTGWVVNINFQTKKKDVSKDADY